LGRIMSFVKTKRGRILKPYQGGYRKGYLVITLVRDGMKEKELVHTLVLEAFVCKCPNGYQGNHINGNKQDNRLGNLEWVTPKENMDHSHFVLGNPYGAPHYGMKGEKSPRAKLTQRQADEIKRLYATGKFTHQKIAAKFGVSRKTVGNIVNNLYWTGE
jgi:hypothetical protein